METSMTEERGPSRQALRSHCRGRNGRRPWGLDSGSPHPSVIPSSSLLHTPTTPPSHPYVRAKRTSRPIVRELACAGAVLCSSWICVKRCLMDDIWFLFSGSLFPGEAVVPTEGRLICLDFTSGLLARSWCLTSWQQWARLAPLRHRGLGCPASGPVRPREWQVRIEVPWPACLSG